MKKFKALAVILLTALMVVITATAAHAIAIFDEDGNLIDPPALGDGLIVPMIAEFGETDLADTAHMPHTVFAGERGEVVDFTSFDGRYFIIIQGEHGLIHFEVTDDTFIPERHPIEGEIITAFRDLNVPVVMIYPPRYTAVAIVIHEDEYPAQAFVGRFRKEGDYLVSYDNERRLVIGEDVEIFIQGMYPGDLGDRVENIEDVVGSVFFVEYTRSARDIGPTTTFVDRIIVLFEKAVHLPGIVVDPDEDDPFEAYEEDFVHYDIRIDGVGLPGVYLRTEGDSVWPNYVPLRAVTDHLGITLTWRGSTREISFTGPIGEVTFRIDVPQFAVISPDGEVSAHTLLEPPIVRNNSTYVPLQFFRDALGFNNAAYFSGSAHINNFETME